MHYSRKTQLAILLFVLSIALYGCGGGSTTSSSSPAAAEKPSSTPSAAADSSPAKVPSARTVTDELGNKVEIPADPKRIVAPYLEDALLSLGVKPEAQWSAGNLLLNYLQPQLKDVPKLDFVALDPEAVMSFSPDLFIVPFAVRVQNGAYEKYSKVAPTYVFQDATKDWRKTLQTLGDLLNMKDQANAALENYDQRMDEFRKTLNHETAGKTAAIMLISDKSFSLMQEGTYSGKVVYDELHFQVPASASGNDWKELSLESLPALNADYIFLMQVDGSDPLKSKQLSSIYETSIWKNLKAVKAGHVFSVDRDYWINTGLQANVKVAEDVQKLLQAGEK